MKSEIEEIRFLITIDFWGQLQDCAKSITFIVIDITYLCTYMFGQLTFVQWVNELQDCAKSITFIDLTYILMYMFGHLTFVNCTTVKTRLKKDLML